MSFTPFDDAQTVIYFPSPTRDGMDTSGWDLYREGVEITSDKFRFLGTQPKIWSGTTDGQIEIVTYGQSEGNIEDDPIGLGAKYKDLPRFDPVTFIILGPNYPMPLVFNDGPIQQNEAAIEPLTIPFKLKTNEGPFYAHAPRAELCEGNEFDSYVTKSSNRFEQFYEIPIPGNIKFFLDQGGSRFGTVNLDQFIADTERIIVPFDDAQTLSPENKLTTLNSFIKIFEHNGERLGEENFIPYGKKSANAGFNNYGLNAGQYGTDSLAYIGFARGS